ncbi:HAD hydrolase family protein [Bacillus sp. SRB_331]|uniref:HAD hydrolase family protein n=1 Tax=Bacillus sp. SRB_331 TaxID=1969379 RepID=UPI000DC3B28A|nr:HAD hydrolase family protein [Bacillus sp. SRB_331]RAN76612.1 capsular biosynthesis protein [Bacillus sp. SRB_331]
MRYIIDLDGTICDLKEPNQSYSEVKPKKNVKEALQEIVDRGDTVIIFTARHMKTCENNVELVEERIGKITRDWLNRYEIPYDQLIFGKPYGDIYIDDLAYKFKGWDEFIKDNSFGKDNFEELIK